MFIGAIKIVFLAHQTSIRKSVLFPDSPRLVDLTWILVD